MKRTALKRTEFKRKPVVLNPKNGRPLKRSAIKRKPTRTTKSYDPKQDRINSLAAFERDGRECLWCKHVVGIKSVGSVPHHIFTRRRNTNF